jgi:hypothetical protein
MDSLICNGLFASFPRVFLFPDFFQIRWNKWNNGENRAEMKVPGAWRRSRSIRFPGSSLWFECQRSAFEYTAILCAFICGEVGIRQDASFRTAGELWQKHRSMASFFWWESFV